MQRRLALDSVLHPMYVPFHQRPRPRPQRWPARDPSPCSAKSLVKALQSPSLVRRHRTGISPWASVVWGVWATSWPVISRTVSRPTLYRFPSSCGTVPGRRRAGVLRMIEQSDTTSLLRSAIESAGEVTPLRAFSGRSLARCAIGKQQLRLLPVAVAP